MSPSAPNVSRLGAQKLLIPLGEHQFVQAQLIF